MATDWFYTTNKTEMGPVTWKELTELVEAGILKPHDLVWTEGMADWIKAINQEGLFTDADGEERVPAKKSAYTSAKPPPGRRTSRNEEDDDEDEEDEKESKRKARKREEDRARTGVGIKVGLIVAGVLGLLLLLGCGGGTLLVVSFWPTKDGAKDGPKGGGPPQAGGPRRETFTINNLNEKRGDVRTYNFTQGKRVIITSTNNLQFPNTDVDLRIFNGGGGMPGANEKPFVWDDRLPNEDRNCRVEFQVPRTGAYRILLVNLGPGKANSCVVNIEEH